jgi:hypothetical protein
MYILIFCSLSHTYKQKRKRKYSYFFNPYNNYMNVKTNKDENEWIFPFLHVVCIQSCFEIHVFYVYTRFFGTILQLIEHK